MSFLEHWTYDCLACESYRIKLSKTLCQALGWEGQSKVGCYAIVRKDGELLCASDKLRNEHGEHPFAAAFDAINDLKTQMPDVVSSIGDIPPANYLVAQSRVFELEAVEAQGRLTLRLGANRISRLTPEPHKHVHAFAKPDLLILISEPIFKVSNDYDFTQGEFS